MSKSHASGWASDTPTPAQIKELFAQIESGRITKARMQGFLRNEDSPIIEKKGHSAFEEFLKKELPRLGLTEWHRGDDAGGSRYFGIIRMRQGFWARLFLGVDEYRSIARVMAEPDPDWYTEAKSDAFRIRVLDPEFRSKLIELAEAFSKAGFDLPVEIVD